MARIYMMLASKGGVGKSWICGLIAQYYLVADRKPICLDTDPSNPTFSSYPAYNAQVIPLLDESFKVINSRNFDLMMQKVLEAGPEDIVIIDTGASTYLPLVDYLSEHGAFELIKDAGHELIIHTILQGGGAAYQDTLDALGGLFATFEEVKAAVWLNEHFGSCQFEGQDFEDSNLYKKWVEQERIESLIRLPRERPDTTGMDLSTMQSMRLTFSEAAGCTDINIMARVRLGQVWSRYWTILDASRL